MKPVRAVKPGQVWEYPGDDLTPGYAMLVVLRENVDPELDADAFDCLLLADETRGDCFGPPGEVRTFWLSGSNWEPLHEAG